MKLNDLLKARTIILNHKNEKMPSRLAYKFMKLLKASDNEDAFYNEKIKALIEEHCVKGEDGRPKTVDGGIKIETAHIADYNKSVIELLDTEVEIPTIRFTLADIEMLSFDVEEMFFLDAFIEE